jgi:Nitroreductase
MTNFSKLIGNRRSIRQYTEEQLSPEQVEQIMKAVLMAPTSKNSRPWHFILVEDKEMLQKLSFCKSSGCAFLSGAALAVVVTTDPLLSEAYMEDSAIAATYIQLQAEDMGLGSCWVHVNGRKTAEGYDSEQYIRDLLDIPLQLHVGCIVALGHKARTGKPHDENKLLWERLHIEKFRHDAEPE